MRKLICILSILSLAIGATTFQPYCSPKERIPGPCTKIYNPVCAIVLNKDGTRSRVDFGNRCEACHDPATIFLIQGKCENIPKGAHVCSPKVSSETQMCPDVYKPVCGYFNQNIQCLVAPCAATFSNGCYACLNDDVAYYIEGPCGGDAEESKKI